MHESESLIMTSYLSARREGREGERSGRGRTERPMWLPYAHKRNRTPYRQP